MGRVCIFCVSGISNIFTASPPSADASRWHWSHCSPASLPAPRMPSSVFRAVFWSVLFSKAAKVKRGVEVALTPLISLVQSSILHFISQLVPGLNAYNSSDRVSEGDLVCHFPATKPAKQGSEGTKLNWPVLGASKAVAQQELSLL